MADQQQLTSVRFDTGTLEDLRLLADLHEGSVAKEIRLAVAAYLEHVQSQEGFHDEVARRQAELLRQHEALAERLLTRKPRP